MQARDPASPAALPVASVPPAADASAREVVRRLQASLIREVSNSAVGIPDVLPFWFGEPDRVTPEFIREAAKAALDAGDTFYHLNLGIPELRQALAEYASRLHRSVAAERIVVTSAGVNGLMLIAQALVSPGDRVVAVTPLWPNIVQGPTMLGADVHRVPVALDPATGRWRLDLDRLLQALTPDTRLLIVNSPNNPTGWVADAATLEALLAHCRRHGIWILSDEAYERIVFDGSGCAPSMLDIASPEDRVVVANTFSKSWLMTGWRMGWIVAPAALVDDLRKLIEFNTSCVPGFVQRAGVVAVRQGEPVVAQFVASLATSRRVLVEALGADARVRIGMPDGGMYVFFQVAGEHDSVGLAKRLVREARLGLAPGRAFGDEGEGYLRWCFAKPAEMLLDGVARLSRFLDGSGRQPAAR